MATASAPAPHATPERRERPSRLVVSETWTSLAIGMIWLVVLVDALFGPDIIVNNASGFTKLPSAVILAVFAWLATWVVAKHGFGRSGDGAG
jgi:hypothetical protein